ncbi:AbrB/MazE/SpoVT family DNA-binding domain-containing protein [Sulfurimonas sp. SAG-AH-194-C21]|nr:AbrB/MazE/SpoVT family DNA-binding domain-containing protein [Sulfurimonas sp. SAG-AH-194-C21]MDF1883030.1 AbrB/MazE/SpoVT family DNA-binding domain-containing protein [Sulfurimonas sp. SAG-AH-194-C21]
MTAKISKWGNSAAVRLPSELLKFLSLHVGDSVEILQKENSIELKVIDDKRTQLIAEAKRIQKHAYKEYLELEASLYDGLEDV